MSVPTLQQVIDEAPRRRVLWILDTYRRVRPLLRKMGSAFPTATIVAAPGRERVLLPSGGDIRIVVGSSESDVLRYDVDAVVMDGVYFTPKHFRWTKTYYNLCIK